MMLVPWLVMTTIISVEHTENSLRFTAKVKHVKIFNEEDNCNLDTDNDRLNGVKANPNVCSFATLSMFNHEDVEVVLAKKINEPDDIHSIQKAHYEIISVKNPNPFST